MPLATKNAWRCAGGRERDDCRWTRAFGSAPAAAAALLAFSRVAAANHRQSQIDRTARPDPHCDGSCARVPRTTARHQPPGADLLWSFVTFAFADHRRLHRIARSRRPRRAGRSRSGSRRVLSAPASDFRAPALSACPDRSRACASSSTATSAPPINVVADAAPLRARRPDRGAAPVRRK